MRKIDIHGLNVEVDEYREVIKIEGCQISFVLFKSWGIHGMPEGVKFRIVKRDEDGFLTVERLDKSKD